MGGGPTGNLLHQGTSGRAPSRRRRALLVEQIKEGSRALVTVAGHPCPVFCHGVFSTDRAFGSSLYSCIFVLTLNGLSAPARGVHRTPPHGLGQAASHEAGSTDTGAGRRPQCCQSLPTLLQSLCRAPPRARSTLASLRGAHGRLGERHCFLSSSHPTLVLFFCVLVVSFGLPRLSPQTPRGRRRPVPFWGRRGGRGTCTIAAPVKPRPLVGSFPSDCLFNLFPSSPLLHPALSMRGLPVAAPSPP